MEKEVFVKIMQRKAERILDEDCTQLRRLLDDFFKARPHFHESGGWYRITDNIYKYLYTEKERRRVLSNLEEMETLSLLTRIDEIKDYLTDNTLRGEF